MSYGGSLNKAISEVGTGEENQYLRVLTLSTSSLLVLEGREFEAALTFDLAAGATKYFSFTVPVSNPQKYVALRERFFKSDLPDVTLDILWDVVSYSGGTPLDIFNDRRSLGIPSIVEFNADPTVDDTTFVLRENDFIPSGASGNKSGGQIGSAGTSRLYEVGEYFIARITNNAQQSNKIKLGYQWAELEVPS